MNGAPPAPLHQAGSGGPGTGSGEVLRSEGSGITLPGPGSQLTSLTSLGL